MQKTFLSNLVLLLFINLLIKPIWTLGIEVNVQRILGPAVYGDYFVLLNYAFLFTVLMDFGLNSFNNRKVSRNPKRMPDYLASLGTLKLLLGLVFMIVMLLAAKLIGFSAEQLRMLVGIGCIIFLQSFLLFLRSNISGIQWYRTDVIISVLDRSISIVLTALLIWGGIEDWGLTIERFIGIQVMAYLIAVIVCVLVLLKRTKRIRFEFKAKEALHILKSSFYYALLVLLVLSYYKIDAVMIERMLPSGAREAGIYAQAYKLLEASIIFAYLFSTLLLPMFSRMIKKKENVTSLVRLADQLMLIPAAILAIGAAFFSQELMTLLYKDGLAQSAEVFPLLILSLIPIGASYIYGTLITAKGDLKTLNTIAAIGVVINIVGNYIFIPRMGIVGAAMMTLITQSIVCLTQVIVAHRMFQLSVSTASGIRIAALFTGLPFIAWAMRGITDHWMFDFLLFALVSLGIAMALGLFSIKKLGEVLKLRESID